MSKLRCECGHIISDSTDFIPYKAWFLKDKDSKCRDKTIEDICSYMEAYKQEVHKEWIQDYFGFDCDEDHSLIITLIQTANDKTGIMYQCENCNRILIQVGDENKYASFYPEDEFGNNILDI